MDKALLRETTLNEHTNGLIRQYIPKKSISKEEIVTIANNEVFMTVFSKKMAARNLGKKIAVIY